MGLGNAPAAVPLADLQLDLLHAARAPYDLSIRVLIIIQLYKLKALESSARRRCWKTLWRLEKRKGSMDNV